MILVDTSVWVSHFRAEDTDLEKLLNEGEVACHPFVIGELACGNLKNRAEILSLLNALPKVQSVTHDEAMHFIEANKLIGRGLGYIDIHVLASAVLSETPLWTLDKRLSRTALMLKMYYKP
jgi:predicted nucleic acid-binding protein